MQGLLEQLQPKHSIVGFFSVTSYSSQYICDPVWANKAAATNIEWRLLVAPFIASVGAATSGDDFFTIDWT